MHVNNVCMFYALYAFIIVWKLQNDAKSLVKLGAGQKLTCFDQLWKGCRDFFTYFLTTIWPTQHTYNIQLTKNYFNEIILFQNSPVQPLSWWASGKWFLGFQSTVPILCSSGFRVIQVCAHQKHGAFCSKLTHPFPACRKTLHSLRMGWRNGEWMVSRQ